jgi:uncharacterized protein YjbI with pentapeptide repeats
MEEQNPSIEDLQKENKDLKEELEKYKKREKATHNALVWTGGRLLNVFIGKDLSKNLYIFLEKVSNREFPTTKNYTNLIEAIINRLLRFPLLQAILSILTFATVILQVWLAFRQTNLMESQTNLMIGQTNLMITQNNLEEANRRSSLVFSFSNIMDQVNEELKNEKNTKRSLSPQLIGRISALAQGLKPYRYLENDSLITKPLSPERGQLLLALINSKLDTLTYGKIYSTTPFSHADLQEAKLDNAYLKRIVLREANLSNADLIDANLRNVDLRNANLNDADLTIADLRNADLNGADLNGADLNGADLNGADLRNADLRNAYLRNAYLSAAYLRNAYLRNADLSYANLSYANLIRADLTLADLTLADLTLADLTLADLSFSIVESPDYTQWKYPPPDYIKDNYKIDSLRKESFEEDFKRLKIPKVFRSHFKYRLDFENKLYLLVPIKKEE